MILILALQMLTNKLTPFNMYNVFTLQCLIHIPIPNEAGFYYEINNEMNVNCFKWTKPNKIPPRERSCSLLFNKFAIFWQLHEFLCLVCINIASQHFSSLTFSCHKIHVDNHRTYCFIAETLWMNFMKTSMSWVYETELFIQFSLSVQKCIILIYLSIIWPKYHLHPFSFLFPITFCRFFFYKSCSVIRCFLNTTFFLE